MTTSTAVRAADAHVHRLYADYSGLPVGVVTQCVQHADTLAQLTWQACPGDDWAAKARAWHQRHEECVFLLMQRTAQRAQRRREHERTGFAGLVADAGPDVLDFGGGLGFTASLLAEAGKRVTYVDVDGPVARFAQWYLAECGPSGITVGTTPADRAELPAGRQWDLVLAERVLESVPDAGAVAERLAQALLPGGTLFVVLDDAAATPLQRPVDVDELLAAAPTLRRLQHVLRGDDGRHAFRAD
ncbi:MAG: class I SAM-dependent methyltransferase [Planctomycetes bacterium]|nr:class I SAM-dependent methyltransferase [Planctomycetota bacterium]